MDGFGTRLESGPPPTTTTQISLGGDVASIILLTFHSRLGAVVHDHPYVEALLQWSSVLVVVDKVYGCEVPDHIPTVTARSY